jgi:hypothetical protein
VSTLIRFLGTFLSSFLLLICVVGRGLAQPSSPDATRADAAATRTELALLRTESRAPELQGLAHGVDGELLDALEQRADVHVAVQPALDLPAMQIAIDCVGELASCLQSMAEQAGVADLLAPVLSADASHGVQLTLLRFDGARKILVTAERSQAEPATPEVLKAWLPSMLAELFEPQQVAAPPTATVPVQQQPAPPPLQDSEPAPKKNRHRVLSLALSAAGVALLGAGVGLAVAAQHAQDDYVRAPVSSKAEINAALATADRGDKLAAGAYASLAVGGAALVAGATVWFLGRHRASKGPEKITIAPALAPGSFGFTLTGDYAP